MSRADLLPPEERSTVRLAGEATLAVSSVTGEGLAELVRRLGDLVRRSRRVEAERAGP